MILMVLIIPFTTLLVGSFLGASSDPSISFIGCAVLCSDGGNCFREVNPGVIEAAEAMGASYWEIIYKIVIPESVPALISGLTVTTISMIGYTAMAGAIGAGGLGALAWQEGFQRGNYTVTLVATVIILIIVFIIRVGDFLAKATDKR